MKGLGGGIKLGKVRGDEEGKGGSLMYKVTLIRLEFLGLEIKFSTRKSFQQNSRDEEEAVEPPLAVLAHLG